jgi:hypothetical protein
MALPRSCCYWPYGQGEAATRGYDFREGQGDVGLNFTADVRFSCNSALRTWSNGGAVGWETFCLSLPAIVGRAGIDRVIPPIMPSRAPRDLAMPKAAGCLCHQLGDRKSICHYRHLQSSRCPAASKLHFFRTPFIRPIFPELRGAVRQHAFGWPALFPVRYLWCREPALLRWRAVHQRCGEPRKRPHCLMCLGYGGD